MHLPELLDDLLIAKAEANSDFRRILERYREIDHLIIDEWLLIDLSLEQSTFILELVERRLHRTSMIFCSQFGPKGWHNKLGNAQITDANLDRIVNDLYSIVIDGRLQTARLDTVTEYKQTSTCLQGGGYKCKTFREI